MINWFGPAPWNDRLCATAPRCEVPVGAACARCTRRIGEDDCGVTVPSGGGAPVTFHLDCHLKSVINHCNWYAAGLVPNETDGMIDGVFLCPTCGAHYTIAEGWIFFGR